MKKIFIFVSIIALFLIFISSLFVDTKTNKFSNKLDVFKNNAIQRGWIPNLLPDSAYKIVETHNIDTNKIKGSFHYLEKDEQTLLDNIKNKERKTFGYKFKFKVNKEKNKVYFSYEP